MFISARLSLHQPFVPLPFWATRSPGRFTGPAPPGRKTSGAVGGVFIFIRGPVADGIA